MIPLYRENLHKVRACGVDVFVLPTPFTPTGMAWAVFTGDPAAKSLYITITGSVHSPLWLFVLLHEAAHHMLGHTTRQTSLPDWMVEKAADDIALDLIRSLQPWAAAYCEREVRQHIRGIMQGYIDHDIWVHVDLTVADWAGCVVPPRMRQRLAAA